jgi:hypothetical protein
MQKILIIDDDSRLVKNVGAYLKEFSYLPHRLGPQQSGDLCLMLPCFFQGFLCRAGGAFFLFHIRYLPVFAESRNIIQKA